LKCDEIVTLKVMTMGWGLGIVRPRRGQRVPSSLINTCSKEPTQSIGPKYRHLHIAVITTQHNPNQMKKTLLTAAIALCGLAAFTSANAQSSYTTGDSLLAFRATGGAGQSLNVQIDVGNLSNLAGAFSFDLTAANSILSTTYGTNWASRNDLYWTIIGSDDNTAQLTLASATLPDPISLSGLATINGNVDGMATAASAGGATQGTIQDNLGASYAYSIYGTGFSGSFSQLDTPPNTFGYFASSVGTLDATKGIYLLNADLNSGVPLPTTNVGTVSIANGVVTIAAVPEPSTYVLFGLGALVLGITLRRRANA
jgi:hypothetical protein